MCCVSSSRPSARRAATRALTPMKGMEDPDWDPAEDDEDDDVEQEDEDTGDDSEPPRRRRSHKHHSFSEEDVLTDVESDCSESSAPSTSKHAVPRKWLEEEDDRLRKAVKSLGEAHWKNIARLVGTRNHVQCLQRWKKVLKPGLVKGLWYPEEDAALAALVERGFRNWGHLAVHMPGRTSKQCRERWCHHLDPSIKKSGYSDQEDQTIIALQKRFGNRWSQIAALLPGRTENAIKIRWRTIQRHFRQQAAGKGSSRRGGGSGGARGGSSLEGGKYGSGGRRSDDASVELRAANAVKPEPRLQHISRAHSWAPAAAGAGSSLRHEAAGGGDSSGSSTAPAFGYAAAAQAEQLQRMQRLQLQQIHLQQRCQQQLQQLQQREQRQEQQQQLAQQLQQQQPQGVTREGSESDPAAAATAPASRRFHWCDGSLLMPLFEGSSAAAAPSTAVGQQQHHHQHGQQVLSPKCAWQQPRPGPLRQELIDQHDQQQIFLLEQQRLTQHQHEQQQQQYHAEPTPTFATTANPWAEAAAAPLAAAAAPLRAPTHSLMDAAAAAMKSADDELVWALPFLSSPTSAAISAPLQPSAAGQLHQAVAVTVRPRASSFDGYAMQLSDDLTALPQDLDSLFMAPEAADADCDVLGVEWRSF